MSVSHKHISVILNNLKGLYSFNKQNTYLSNPPSFIWIEPTNHCNLHCIMCPNGQGLIHIKKGFMEFELYKKIINEIKGYASTVVLALNGEPLLHPKLSEMIKFAHQNHVNISLNTNATLLTKELSHKLLEGGLNFISFAFDGFSKNHYEKIRKGADFEKTLKNIQYFLTLKKKKKINAPYSVLSVLMLNLGENNFTEKNNFFKLFDGLIDEIRLREVSSWGKIFKDTKQFSYRNNKGYFYPCSRLWTSISIAWNGDVVPCIYNANHEYLIGNLQYSSLKELWNHHKLLKLRRSMFDKTYLSISPLCDNCIVVGTPPILGIPSGIRISLSDAFTNIMGYGFERIALKFANILANGNFSSRKVN
ncbi:MAG: radical SAM protein [Desulfobacterales bacterium]|nr:radical SAM protein [Desulfobacterales bacterium]